MMKRYICFIFLLGLLACQEDELVKYSEERDALDFKKEEGLANPEYRMNFATESEEIVEQDAPRLYYFGDSLREKTVRVYLKLQGFPSPDERPYKLKAVPLEDEDSLKVAQVRFEEFYSLAPNCLEDTVTFTILRPEGRGHYGVGVTMETEGMDAFFGKGTDEDGVLRLYVSDRYEEPEAWKYRIDWLGEFSEEKYAFMVSLDHRLFTRDYSPFWDYTDGYNQYLRTALDEFNARVPEEERKDFTFPLTTKPVWWDTRKDLLGEFSEDKNAFIREVLGDERLVDGDKLEYWNLILRRKAEAEGMAFGFPAVTKPSLWWNATELGEWSVEKQEFIIEHFFPVNGFRIVKNTWDYANCLLRLMLEDHPDAAFSFPVAQIPEWWQDYERFVGDYTETKRDVVVLAAFLDNAQWGDYSIDNLLNPNQGWFEWNNGLDKVKEQVRIYNASHPDAPITLPVPAWWTENASYLGDYTDEKEAYVDWVFGLFRDPWGGKVANGEEIATYWHTAIRLCVGRYNQETGAALENDFPVNEGKWSWWDNYADVWGEYSDAKKVFVLYVTTPQLQYGGTVDESWESWNPYGSSNLLDNAAKQAMHQDLINAKAQYESATGETLPFDFN